MPKPRGKLATWSNFGGEILLYSHFSCSKFYSGKIIVIFSGGGGGGGGGVCGRGVGNYFLIKIT